MRRKVQLGSDGGETLSIYVAVPVHASEMLDVNFVVTCRMGE